MIIYMWSGPRNLSTALMRSFENRGDTKVWDEPLYAYYLKETKKNHPLAEQIIKKYETNINILSKKVSQKLSNKKILYQKHMSHHILSKTPLNWLKNGVNCFLIRNPKDVLLSYIKKNNLKNSRELGYSTQIKIFKKIQKLNQKTIVINAYDLALDPQNVLSSLCDNLKINFSKKMLKWPIGKRKSDGIWGDIWYHNVKSSTKFEKLKKNNQKIPIKYKKIYKECLKIYKELNSYNIINER